MKLRSLWRKRRDVMEFNDKEKASLVKQEILQALHDENKRLGLYDDVYAVETLEQENRLLRARNDRLEKELAMYQVQRLGQEIQPERDYERGFIDGMQKQMQSSVDKAVNRLAQPEDKKCENCGEFGECCQLARGEQDWIERERAVGYREGHQNALKQMAQPEQEPVAWVVYSSAENDIVWADKGKRLKQNTPLYTAPPQRKPLTDEQRKAILKGWQGRNWTVGDIIDAIEAAHGIKE